MHVCIQLHTSVCVYIYIGLASFWHSWGLAAKQWLQNKTKHQLAEPFSFFQNASLGILFLIANLVRSELAKLPGESLPPLLLLMAAIEPQKSSSLYVQQVDGVELLHSHNSWNKCSLGFALQSFKSAKASKAIESNANCFELSAKSWASNLCADKQS